MVTLVENQSTQLWKLTIVVVSRCEVKHETLVSACSWTAINSTGLRRNKLSVLSTRNADMSAIKYIQLLSYLSILDGGVDESGRPVRPIVRVAVQMLVCSP